MSFFNWFAAKPSPPLGQSTDSGAGSISKQGLALASNDRRIKRQARREQLYLVIRETLTHLGVLSASYKFKVLALDQHGEQFLVMIDLAESLQATGAQAHDVEKQIIQSARNRFEVVVTAVYWRANAQMTPPAASVFRSPPEIPRAEAFIPRPRHEEALAAAVVPGRRYEPIEADEVAAFRQALQAAAPKRAPKPEAKSKSRIGRSSYALLTGFEETEMPNFSPALGTTQYGDLV